MAEFKYQSERQTSTSNSESLSETSICKKLTSFIFGESQMPTRTIKILVLGIIRQKKFCVLKNEFMHNFYLM